jgi:hypothetical protein
MKAIVLAALLALTGCATGLAAVENHLPDVANGVHTAAQAGYDVLRPICRARSTKCRADKIDRPNCDTWKKCEAIRTALEAVTRGIEDDLIGIKSKIEAFRKVKKAIEKLKGGQ